MGKFLSETFNSHKQDYETPQELFDILDLEFHFTLDVCATDTNFKVNYYFTEEDNGLIKSWSGICWMNPPYNAKRTWIKKAYTEFIKNDCIVVCLVPARTNTNWWHDYCMKGEIRFIRGRLIFKGMEYGLPQPLAIVIFGKGYKGSYKSIDCSSHK